MLLKTLFLIVIIGVTHAETPDPGLQSRAPYPAAGWRPQVPFDLPGEFLPPVERQDLRPRPRPNVEISKERVEFAGTLSATQSNYLPPEYAVPSEQALPSFNQANMFNKEVTIQSSSPKPAAQYGPPADRGFRVVYAEDKESKDDNSLPSLLAQSEVQEGRYYIVSRDNKLQRVVYHTAQSLGDNAADDGFIAELKYSTVGELQDPVYKYNNEGQLVRVLK